MKSTSILRVLAAAATTLLVSSLPACDSSDTTTPPDGNTNVPPSSDPSGDPPSGKPLYAIASMIFDDTGQTTYIALLDSLDTQPKVTLDKAREFAGYAAADASGGKIIVGDGEKPQLTRFAIGDDGSWKEEQTLSFSNYSSTALTASIFVSPTKAYAPFDGTNHVVWNPQEFVIVGPMTAPASIPLTREGLDVRRGYGNVVANNYVYQTYYWSNDNYTKYTETSQIALIDTTKDEVVAAVDVPCPHLHIATKDEQGNTYFSNGQGSIASAVLDANHPKNCVARIKAGETTLDTSFTTKFRDLTDGREGNNFFYVGNNIGFFNVYHAERDNVTPETEPTLIDNSSNYHLWTLDLSTMQAKMMEGIDYAGGQYVAFRIDDRVFVAIPAGDYSSTSVYEILPTGTAEKRFDVQAWMFHMFRVR